MDKDYKDQMLVNGFRYLYIRDVILKPMRRKDLPEELGQYFYRDDVDIQFPTVKDIDAAIDTLMREELMNKPQARKSTQPLPTLRDLKEGDFR